MKKVLLFSLAVLLTTSVFADERILGGDLSLVPAYEAAGDVWLDANGNAIDDLLLFLRDEAHWNAVRVRLVVNPAYGNDIAICQDIEYVEKLGKRIKDAKMNFLLDIFYSDTWADVSKQWIPTDWEMSSSTDLTELATKVSSYTTEVLEELIKYGATPDYVQIGNEVSYGMLWDSQSGGSYSNMFNCTGGYSSQSTKIDRFATLLEAGASAVRDKLPNAKIILQCERSGSAAYNFYDYVNSAGFDDYDIIGLSYYPMWQGSLSTLKSTLNGLASFGKPIQIVETAFYNNEYGKSSSDWSNDCNSWDASFSGQATFIGDLVATLADFSNVTGLYYWFPEECGNGADSGGTNRVLSSWINRGLWELSWKSESHKFSGAATIEAMAGFLDLTFETTTTEEDVSTDYFSNLDFENCDTSTDLQSAEYDAVVAACPGWTIADTGFKTFCPTDVDSWVSTLASGKMYKIWTEEGQSYTTGSFIEQTSKTELPAGDYKVSCVAHNETADAISLFANEEEEVIPVESDWGNADLVSVNITLEEDDYLTIGLKTNFVSSTSLNFYVDNFTVAKVTTTSSSSSIKNIAVDKTIVGYYNLMGQKFDAPQKGINIIIYSDGSSQKTLVK